MPLTPLQQKVLRSLAANRSAESHFAGGIVLHSREDSVRFSQDFDIFHDAAEMVAASSEKDVAVLREAGYSVDLAVGDWTQPATFRKARIQSGDETLEIDWALDSAVRFFPIEPDPLLGWRLHLFDMATNKVLALASRSATRDYVDIVELHKTYPLHAIVWAACGKDPGYSPLLLLDMMRRFARISPGQLKALQAREIDPVQLKSEWIEMSEAAEKEITSLADSRPELPIGVAFVDAQGVPKWIRDDPGLRVHSPSIGGCWPSVHAPGE